MRKRTDEWFVRCCKDASLREPIQICLGWLELVLGGCRSRNFKGFSYGKIDLLEENQVLSSGEVSRSSEAEHVETVGVGNLLKETLWGLQD